MSDLRITSATPTLIRPTLTVQQVLEEELAALPPGQLAAHQAYFNGALESIEAVRNLAPARTYHEHQSWLHESADKVLHGWKEAVKQPEEPPPSVCLPQTELSRTLEEHFDRWDTNGNGVLTQAELDTAMGDPANRGNAAVALATLKSLFDRVADLERDHPWFARGGITRQDIAALDRETRKDSSLRRDVEGYWSHFQGRLDGVDRTVFNGRPDPRAIRQGSANSCGFLSAIAAMCAIDPDAVVRMIRTNPDGTYTVTFRPGMQVTVEAPTEAELAYYSNAGSNGIWIAILEKAYGKLGQDDKLRFLSGSPYDRYQNGLYPQNVIRDLTGHDSDLLQVGNQKPQDLAGRLARARREGKVMLATVARGNQRAKDRGLVDWHIYAVVGYDERSQTLTIQNPWGRREITGPDGQPRDGQDDGNFTVSLQEFMELFDYLTIER